jgi:hypothetical protein
VSARMRSVDSARRGRAPESHADPATCSGSCSTGTATQREPTGGPSQRGRAAWCQSRGWEDGVRTGGWRQPRQRPRAAGPPKTAVGILLTVVSRTHDTKVEAACAVYPEFEPRFIQLYAPYRNSYTLYYFARHLLPPPPRTPYLQKPVKKCCPLRAPPCSLARLLARLLSYAPQAMSKRGSPSGSSETHIP